MGITHMKTNNIGYLLREGIRGVFLHGFMSFAAIWVTVASLLIMGTFTLVLYKPLYRVMEKFLGTPPGREPVSGKIEP